MAALLELIGDDSEKRSEREDVRRGDEVGTPCLVPLAPSPSPMSFTIHGIGVSGGIAIGHAHLLSHAQLEVEHYNIAESEVAAGAGPLRQRHRHGARRAGRAGRAHSGQCAARVRRVPEPAPDDPGRQHAVRGAEHADRPNASATPNGPCRSRPRRCSISSTASRTSYLRERKADVVQVVERVLKALTGQPRTIPAPRHRRRTASWWRTTSRRPT